MFSTLRRMVILSRGWRVLMLPRQRPVPHPLQLHARIAPRIAPLNAHAAGESGNIMWILSQGELIFINLSISCQMRDFRIYCLVVNKKELHLEVVKIAHTILQKLTIVHVF